LVWKIFEIHADAFQGPDALLDPAGVGQAQAVNAAWKQQAQAGIPLPQTLYSSPMRRALSTVSVTWHDILLNKGYVPYVSYLPLLSSP